MSVFKRVLRKIQTKGSHQHNEKREATRWAFRLFLDREIDDEFTLNYYSEYAHSDLRTNFMASDEFSRNNDYITLMHSDWLIKETKYGFRLFVYLRDISISRAIILDRYEIPEVSFISKFLQPGQYAIDIGANIGFYSMLLSKLVGERGKVISFEPIPHLFKALTRSRDENRFAGICDIHNLALSDHDGEVSMVFAPKSTNFGGSYISGDKDAPAEHERTTVKTLKLDGFMSSRKVDFIKIDVEGAEFLALSGGLELIKRDMPVILCELHNVQLEKVSSTNATSLISLLTDLGYRCNLLQEDGTLGEAITQHDSASVVNVIFSKSEPLPA